LRRFIRLHPWRLEIVPAVAVIMAIGHLIYYRCSDLSLVVTRIVNQGAGPDYVSLLSAWMIGYALFLWSTEIGFNSNWVGREKRKRFNPGPLIFQFNILLLTSFVVFGTRWVSHVVSHVTTRHFSGTPIIAAVVTGLVVTAVLELTRRYVPKDEVPEPAPPTSHPLAEQVFRYEERHIDWSTVGPAMGLAVLCFAPVAYGVPRYMIGFGIVALVLAVGLARRRFLLTDRMVSLSVGPFRQRVSVSDIQSCCSPRLEGDWKRPKNVQRGHWHALGVLGVH